MLIVRWIGRLLVAAAAIVAGLDAPAYINDGRAFRVFAELWRDLHPQSLAVAEPAIARHVPFGDVLWYQAVVPLISQPAWAVILVPGLLLWFLGRERARVRR